MVCELTRQNEHLVQFRKILFFLEADMINSAQVLKITKWCQITPLW